MEIPEDSDRRAIVFEEQVIMVDSPASFQVPIKCKLPLQDRDRARVELDRPVFARFGRVFIGAIDSGFADRQGSTDFIEVPDVERNFL
jgi:hypothetical protein